MNYRAADCRVPFFPAPLVGRRNSSAEFAKSELIYRVKPEIGDCDNDSTGIEEIKSRLIKRSIKYPSMARSNGPPSSLDYGATEFHAILLFLFLFSIPR